MKKNPMRAQQYQLFQPEWAKQQLEIGTIFKTTDYSVFKNLLGNRSKTTKKFERRVKAITDSLIANSGKQYKLVEVDPDLRITDGQARVAALSRLQLPINAIVTEPRTISEIQDMNNFNQKWDGDDKSYSLGTLGNKSYQMFNDFRDKFPFIPTYEARIMLTKTASGAIKDFNAGTMVLDDVSSAYEIGMRIESLSKAAPVVYKTRPFVRAMIRLLNNPKFNYDFFLRKLTLQPASLTRTINTDAQVLQIQNIYNYRVGADQKVSFVEPK